MPQRNFQKSAVFFALALFSASSLSAQESDRAAKEPVEAAAVYKKISALVKLGDLAGAYELMTDEQRNENIGFMLVSLATDIMTKRPIPKQLEDGTKVDAKPADLGFDDTWDPPAWMKTEKMGASSSDWEKLEADLLKRFNELPDRKKALKNLYLLNRSLGGKSVFEEDVVAPRKGFKPRQDRLWISSEGDAEQAWALLFVKQDDGWKYAGIDWETDEQVAAMWRFEEKKDHPIAGKGPDGEDVSLKGLKGKTVLIDFWGTW